MCQNTVLVVIWYKKDKKGMNWDGNMTYIHSRLQTESHSWIFRVLWYSSPKTTLLQMSRIFGLGLHIVLVRDYLFDSVEKNSGKGKSNDVSFPINIGWRAELCRAFQSIFCLLVKNSWGVTEWNGKSGVERNIFGVFVLHG